MPLVKVTLTGADDTIDPKDLYALSKAYPFVEWGILLGSSVKPRYPSLDWINKLQFLDGSTGESQSANFSLHLCGPYIDALFDVDFTLPYISHEVHAPVFKHLIQTAIQKDYKNNLQNILDATKFYIFDRVQYNIGDRPYSETVAKRMRDFTVQCFNQGIIQRRPSSLNFIRSDYNCVGLNDLSGGRGKTPDVWPHNADALLIGYAGGLGPDNIERELPLIEQAANGGDFWVDMESKLRDSNDRFDIHICHDVLRKCALYRQSQRCRN